MDIKKKTTLKVLSKGFKALYLIDTIFSIEEKKYLITIIYSDDSLESKLLNSKELKDQFDLNTDDLNDLKPYISHKDYCLLETEEGTLKCKEDYLDRTLSDPIEGTIYYLTEEGVNKALGKNLKIYNI